MSESSSPGRESSFEVWGPEKFRKIPVLSELFLWRVNASIPSLRDAKCVACGATTSKAKTDRCASHIIKKCPERSNIDPDLIQTLEEQYQGTIMATKKVIASSKSAAERQLHDAIDRLIVELIAVNLLSLSVCESSELRDLAKKASPSYTPPGRKRLRGTLLAKQARQSRASALEKISKAPRYSVTLECDGWTSGAGSSLIAIVITLHSGESFLLDLIDASTTRHTSEYFADLVINSLRSHKIDEAKLNCLVTDEASNMKKAREMICSSFQSQHVLQYRCLAHTFNLVIGSICNHRRIKPYMSKLVDLIKKLSSNKFLLSHIRQRGGGAPVKIVPTRWYSVTNAIKAALELREDLTTLVQDQALRAENIKTIIDDEDFWSVRRLYPFLKEISSIIAIAEASDSLLSNAFRAFLEFFKLIEQSTDPFRGMIERAGLLHFGKIDVSLALTSYALDPNHKLEFLSREAFNEVELTCNVILIEMGHNDTIARALREDLVRYKESLKDVTSYIQNVYSWWDQQKGYSVLKKVGLRLAACHASSANTERIFSTLSATITPGRNKLGLDAVLDLTTLRVEKLSERKISSRRRSRSSPEPTPGPSSALGVSIVPADLNIDEVPDDGLELEVENIDDDDCVFELPSDNLEDFNNERGCVLFRSFIDFSRPPVRGTSRETTPRLSRSSVDPSTQARRALDTLGPFPSEDSEEPDF